jgi:hypothetical protein
MTATPLRQRTGSLNVCLFCHPFSGVTHGFWRATGKIGEDRDVRDDFLSR